MMIILFIAALLFAGPVPGIQAGSYNWGVDEEPEKPFHELRLGASFPKKSLQVAQQRESSEFKELLPHVVAAKAYRSKMEEFVQFAANGNTSSLIDLISREAIRSAGPERIKANLENEIIPFFSQYKSLHNVTSVNPAVGPSGHVGYWFDTYIVTVTGEVRPFTIVVVREDGRLVVTDIIVNRCRQDRHPFCP